MNPIPTTKAMAPAPGKGVSSYPTPVIQDTVIVEVVNAWKGEYVPLEYGTKWDDVPHASVQGSFPDHKLISQAPNSEDGQWVKRIWANDRVNQESYNYAIKYIEGSKDHPTYVRTYVIPRNEYIPLEDGDPDPLFAGAILTEQEVSRTEGELDSQYVTVTRVYDTLPGPLVSAQALVDTPTGLALANVTRQQVIVANTTPSGSFNTLQDAVTAEDTFKGQRETVTVPAYPELTTYELDEDLGVVVVTEREVVNHNTPYSAPPLVLTVQDRPLDQWKTLRITSRMANLPPNRVEYKTQQFTFPALLININAVTKYVGFGRYATGESAEDVDYGTGINTFVSVNPNIRPAVSLPTRIKTITEFIDANQSGIPSPESVYQITPQNIQYSGTLFNFNFGDCLFDGGSITVTAAENDQRYGGPQGVRLVESITFAPSIPTRTAYQNKVATSPEVVIASSVEYYRSNIWIKRTSYVTLI
jgi:hypothetical protein